MSITSAIVLFAVTWFMVMFITLPIGLRTQGDEDDIVPGTHAGAPANFRLKRTIVIVTIVTAVIWVILFTVISSGWISVRDFDWRHVMGGQ
jgi:predicted secreted protein